MWTHHGQDKQRPCHQEMTFQWHGRHDSEIGPPEFNFHDGVESAGSGIQDGLVGGGPFNISHDVAARTIAQTRRGAARLDGRKPPKEATTMEENRIE